MEDESDVKNYLNHKTYKTWGRAHLRTKCRFPDERLDNNLWQAQTWLSFFIVRFRLGVVYGLLFWCVLSTSFHCLNTCKKIFRGGHRYVNWNFLRCFHRVKTNMEVFEMKFNFFLFFYLQVWFQVRILRILQCSSHWIRNIILMIFYFTESSSEMAKERKNRPIWSPLQSLWIQRRHANSVSNFSASSSVLAFGL